MPTNVYDNVRKLVMLQHSNTLIIAFSVTCFFSHSWSNVCKTSPMERV